MMLIIVSTITITITTMEITRVNSPFHDNYINNKIASIKLEFKSYLDQLIRKELQRRQEIHK